MARSDPARLKRRFPGSIGFAAAILVVALAVLAAVTPATHLARPEIGAELRAAAAAVIFTASYIAIAIGKIPGLSIDRAGIALVGASLMVVSGALTPEEAYQAIDLDTITLLLGVMIVVANLRLSGFFAAATEWIARRARQPLVLLAAVIGISGFFSAFLVNDTICLVLTPLVLDLTARLGRKPLPYLLALAMASNVGSTATITGNPQNIMIGSFSRIPYAAFTAALGPVALAGLVAIMVLIVVFFRGAFAGETWPYQDLPSPRINRPLTWRALIATAAMVALFFAGQPPAKVAIAIGGVLLLTRRLKSTRIYAEIDWSLLLMFAGLFIIVAGAQRVLLTPEMIGAIGRAHLDHVPVLAAVTAIVSNIVSNVPAVLMIRPFIEPMPNHDLAWLTVAMASTLAGNFTVLGSIANLIVVQKAAARGIVISFWDYFRVGAPLTLITLGIGVFWLSR